MADSDTSTPRSRTVPVGQQRGPNDPEGRARLAIGADAAGTIETRLVSDDNKFDELVVPLYDIEAYRPDVEEPSEVNDLTPITPMVDATRPATGDHGSHEGWRASTPLDQRAHIIERGYITIWLNGYLWREFQAVGNGQFSEVNLTYYAGDDERQATGVETPTIMVPRRRRSRDQEVRIGYSYVQWSWQRIERFGGMAYDSDPRVKGSQRRSRQAGQPDVAIPEPELNAASPAQCRAERLDQLPLNEAPALIRAANQGGDVDGQKQEPDRAARRAGLTVGGGVVAKAMGDYPAAMVLNSQFHRAFQVRERHDKAMFQRDSYYRLFEEGYVPPNAGFDETAGLDTVAAAYSDWQATVDELFRPTGQGYAAPELEREAIARHAKDRERNKKAFQVAALIRNHYGFEPASRLPVLEPRRREASGAETRARDIRGNNMRQRARQGRTMQGDGLSAARNRARVDRTTERHDRLAARVDHYQTRRTYYADNINNMRLADYLGLGGHASSLHQYLETILETRRELVALMQQDAFWDELSDYLDRPAPGFLLAHSVMAKLIASLPQHPGGAQAETFLDYEGQGQTKEHRAYHDTNYAIVADLWERLREDDYADYLFPDGDPGAEANIASEPARANQCHFPTQAFRDWLAANDDPKKTNLRSLAYLDRLAAHHLGSPRPGERTADHDDYNQTEDGAKLLPLAHRLLKFVNGVAGALSEPHLPSLEKIEEIEGNIDSASRSITELETDTEEAKQRVSQQETRVQQLREELDEIDSESSGAAAETPTGDNDEQAKRGHRRQQLQADLQSAQRQATDARREHAKRQRRARASQASSNPVVRHLAAQPAGRQATLISLTLNGRVDFEPDDSQATGVTGHKGVRPFAPKTLDKIEAQLRSLGQVFDVEGERYVRTDDGILVPLRLARSNSSAAHHVVDSIRRGEDLIETVAPELHEPMAGKLVYVAEPDRAANAGDPERSAKVSELEEAKAAEAETQDALEAKRREYRNAQQALTAERDKLRLSGFQQRVLAGAGTVHTSFFVLEVWQLRTKLLRTLQSRSLRDLLDLIATGVGTTATALEVAGAGAKAALHRGLIGVRFGRGLMSIAAYAGGIALIVDSLKTFWDMAVAYQADNEEQLVALAFMLAGFATIGMAGVLAATMTTTIVGVFVVLIAGFYAAYFQEDDTDEWLRNSPWGTTPFQEPSWFNDGPYADANEPDTAMGLAAFQRSWQTVTLGADQGLNRQDGGASWAATIHAAPSSETGGDLAARLEVQPVAISMRGARGHRESIIAGGEWLPILRETPMGSESVAGSITDFEIAVNRVLEDTEWRPADNGAGYTLVIQREAFERLAKGFVAAEGLGSATIEVRLSLRLRTRRQFNPDGDATDGYSVPVAGGPHDEMPAHEASADHGWFVDQLDDMLTLTPTELERVSLR
jgi:hypothetical protein